MTDEIRLILTFLLAFFSTLFVLPNLSHIANRIGLIDRPNERTVHTIPRPLVGGLGIVISATFSALLFVPLQGLRGYFSGLAVLLLVGFFDDFLEIGHGKKFLAQIIATSLLMFLSKVYLLNFGDLLGFGNIMVSPRWLVWLITIFCVVGVTNALNMIDGLDGLAGGVSFISFLAFAVLASLTGKDSLMLLSLAISGAVLGFLHYNWAPSVLFMGDAGSLCLGFSLSFMAIALTQTGAMVVRPVVVLLVLTVPIADTLTVMIKRILAGNNPFKPDKTHLHHTLVLAGLENRQSVSIILILCFIFSLISVFGLLYHVREPILFMVFSCYFILNFFSETIVRKFMDITVTLRRKEKPQRCPVVIHSFFRRIGRAKIFRGATRYQVDTVISCENHSHEDGFSGSIVNLSKTGFLARINCLGLFCKECNVTIKFPEDAELVLQEVSVEHLWMNEEHDCQLHGFMFVDLSEEQRKTIALMLDFLVSNSKKV